MGVTDNGISGGREFPSTSWSVIARARDPGSADYLRHLQRLVEIYWRPVYCVVRHAWAKTHDDAKDLTQDFFATVVLDRALVSTYAPERGSFRALLRTALARFMHDVGRGHSRAKRGGGAIPVSLDQVGAQVMEPADASLTPDQVFDSAWNEAVLQEAMALLEQRLGQQGKAVAFEVFKRYELEGDGDESYGDVAEALSLSEAQVKYDLRLARRAFREAVTDVVRG